MAAICPGVTCSGLGSPMLRGDPGPGAPSRDLTKGQLWCQAWVESGDEPWQDGMSNESVSPACSDLPGSDTHDAAEELRSG